MAMTDEEVRTKAWNKVKIQALLKGSVFITTIGFNLKFAWDKHIPTAGTDGSSILFNPDYFDVLDKEERLFIYLHEVWHCAFLHMIRRGNKDKAKWNIAADNVINLMLVNQGYKMPKGGHANSAYRDMSTDQIYDILPDVPPPPDYPFDILDPSSGDDGEGKDGNATEKTKIALEDLIIRASTASQIQGEDAGKIPGEISISIQQLINPQLPWESLLLKFVEDHAKNDFSWRRPNRRMLDISYLPSLYSESIANITIAVDTSCSVSDEQFTAFLSEMDYIRECFPIELMTVVSFDTSIKNVDHIKEGDSLTDVKFKGRGGTDLDWMPKYLKKHPSKVLIVFSDLEVDIPSPEPDVPILWICVDNPSRTVPYGTLIHYSS